MKQTISASGEPTAKCDLLPEGSTVKKRISCAVKTEKSRNSQLPGIPAESATVCKNAAEHRTHNKIAYLIDSENMGREWITLLREDDPSREYYLFTSEKSTNVSIYDLPVICRIMGENRIKIIPCVVGTPNAMDFQIMFLAGQLSRDEPDTEIYIFSKDHDYDCVIRNDSLVQGTVIGRTAKPICPVKCGPAKQEAQKPSAPKAEKKKASHTPKTQKQIKASQINWLQSKLKSFGFNDEQSTWATTYIYSLIRNGSVNPGNRLASLEKNLKKKYGAGGEELFRKNKEKLNQLLTGKNIFPA